MVKCTVDRAGLAPQTQAGPALHRLGGVCFQLGDNSFRVDSPARPGTAPVVNLREVDILLEPRKFKCQPSLSTPGLKQKCRCMQNCAKLLNMYQVYIHG